MQLIYSKSERNHMSEISGDEISWCTCLYLMFFTKKVFQKEILMFLKYFLEIKQGLVQEVRDSLLTEKTPDLYMRVLLTLLQGADHYRENYEKDKIFKQYFSKQEYKQAKARLKVISRDWPPIPPPPPPDTTPATAWKL